MNDRTRFKYGLIFCGIVFLEAILRHFLSNFPFEFAVSAQGAALGIYTVAKTANNQLSMRLNGRSDVTKSGNPS